MHTTVKKSSYGTTVRGKLADNSFGIVLDFLWKRESRDEHVADSRNRRRALRLISDGSRVAERAKEQFRPGLRNFNFLAVKPKRKV